MLGDGLTTRQPSVHVLSAWPEPCSPYLGLRSAHKLSHGDRAARMHVLFALGIEYLTNSSKILLEEWRPHSTTSPSKMRLSLPLRSFVPSDPAEPASPFG